ncbi:hypothetical protein V2A60_003405 [Cordyceps javanica]
MSGGPGYGANRTMGGYQSSRVNRDMEIYSTRAPEDIVLPMGITEQLGELEYVKEGPQAKGVVVDVEIFAQIHKNFFMGEKFFTCYRRNYLSCACAFEMSPNPGDIPLIFTPMADISRPTIIYEFAMGISAIVADHHHQEVMIIQHTPKRDKGPITLPKKQRMAPRGSAVRYFNPRGPEPPPVTKSTTAAPAATAPVDTAAPAAAGASTAAAATASSEKEADKKMEAENKRKEEYLLNREIIPQEHSFDRLQFKTATANNGERRAGQQRYQLVVELWGNQGSAEEPNWIRIAIQRSADIVVRGRSPGHYAKENRKSSGSGGGGGGGGPSSHGNYGVGNGGPADYANASMFGAQHPNSYGAPTPYDDRGADMYGGGGHTRREMAAYSIDNNKSYDSTRIFPSAFTNPTGYADPSIYGQGVQTVGVSPMELYGKRGEPDMGVLPRPEPQMRMGPDARCNVSTTTTTPMTGVVPSVLPPIMPSMVNSGGFMQNS